MSSDHDFKNLEKLNKKLKCEVLRVIAKTFNYNLINSFNDVKSFKKKSLEFIKVYLRSLSPNEKD